MKKTILLLALFGLIVGLTSCQKPEEATISKYFQAMKHDDKETMAAMAIEAKTIKFTNFKIVKIEPGTPTPLELPNLVTQLNNLDQKKKDQLQIAQNKNDDYEALLDELGSKKTPQLTEAENAAKAEKEKFLELSKEYSLMQKKIEIEKRIITASTSVDSEFELYTGESVVSRATVAITLESGETKDYIFILRKDTLKTEGQNRPRVGRLVILKMDTPEEIDKAPAADTPAATEPQQ